MKRNQFVDEAKGWAKGKVTIPRKDCELLGGDRKDRISFIAEDGTGHRENSLIYALERFQDQMQGEAQKAGFFIEEDLDEWMTNSRREERMQ